MKKEDLELDLCYYDCGDLICDNDPCIIYNAITRHISGDENMTGEKVYEEYLKALEEVKFIKERCNPEYEMDYRGILESIIQFILKPNLEEHYAYKDLVKIKK